VGRLRTIFNVLIEPIKKEFALSDTTMGQLAGFGFVLFYSLLSAAVTSTLGALLFIWAARSIRADIQRARLSDRLAAGSSPLFLLLF